MHSVWQEVVCVWEGVGGKSEIHSTPKKKNFQTHCKEKWRYNIFVNDDL